MGWRLASDMIILTRDGEPVEFDDVGAVFRELTVEFGQDELRGPATHPCAVANRQCPTN
jgi:hypothetical protein